MHFKKYAFKKKTNWILSCVSLCEKQDAKETLLDPAKRANYDKWRNSGLKVSYKSWLGMKEHVHQVFFLCYTFYYYQNCSYY